MSKYRDEIESLINADFSRHQKEMLRIYQRVAGHMNRHLREQMVEWEHLNFSQRLEVNRLTSIMLQLENQIDFVRDRQAPHLFRHLNSVAHLAYNELFYDFEMTHGMHINFAMLPTNLLETVINIPIAQVRLSERLEDGVLPELRARLQEILVRGFTNGHGYAKMARDIREASAMSYRRSIIIARTEGHRTMAITRQRSQLEAESRGIKLQKRWLATLDDVTRDKHADLDGQTVGINERFEIGPYSALQPGMFGVAEMDINCRCTTLSIIKGYEPTLRKDNVTGEFIPFKNYREWQLSKERQEQERNPASRDRFVQVRENEQQQGGTIPQS